MNFYYPITVNQTPDYRKYILPRPNFIPKNGETGKPQITSVAREYYKKMAWRYEAIYKKVIDQKMKKTNTSEYRGDIELDFDDYAEFAELYLKLASYSKYEPLDAVMRRIYNVKELTPGEIRQNALGNWNDLYTWSFQSGNKILDKKK